VKHGARLLGAALAAAALCSPAGAQAPGWSSEARLRLQAGRGADVSTMLAERERLLAEGQARLASGDVDGARRSYEAAALTAHSPEIELGLLRTALQGGDYAQGLAFAAHVEGAHPDTPAGAAMYAWLLQLGGQPVEARKRITTAHTRWPDDAAVQWVRHGIEHPRAERAGAPLRMGPFESGVPAAAGARVAASGVRIGERHAVVPAGAVAGTTGLWLRDGLGRTRAASRVSVDSELGVALLVADAPFGPDWPVTTAARDPFPGSPAWAAAYASGARAPQWPAMAIGFLGAPVRGGNQRRLGFELPASAPGGPAFDQVGRLIGMTVAAADGHPRLVPWSSLRAMLPGAADAPAAATAAPRTAPDAIYETAMRLALQVIVAD
jgi:hypothetical protein